MPEPELDPDELDVEYLDDEYVESGKMVEEEPWMHMTVEPPEKV